MPRRRTIFSAAEPVARWNLFWAGINEPGATLSNIHDLRAYRDHGTLHVLDYPTCCRKNKQFIRAEDAR